MTNKKVYLVVSIGIYKIQEENPSFKSRRYLALVKMNM